jgi:bifunctional DNase/RNase
MKNLIDISGFRVEKVVIYDVKNGAYLARIHLEKGFFMFKQKVVLDSRPSDAVALALRLKVPIFVMPHLLINPLEIKPDTLRTPKGIEG